MRSNAATAAGSPSPRRRALSQADLRPRSLAARGSRRMSTSTAASTATGAPRHDAARPSRKPPPSRNSQVRNASLAGLPRSARAWRAASAAAVRLRSARTRAGQAGPRSGACAGKRGANVPTSLGRFPLVSAHVGTSDHRSLDARILAPGRSRAERRSELESRPGRREARREARGRGPRQVDDGVAEAPVDVDAVVAVAQARRAEARVGPHLRPVNASDRSRSVASPCALGRRADASRALGEVMFSQRCVRMSKSRGPSSLSRAALAPGARGRTVGRASPPPPRRGRRRPRA